MFFFPTRCGPRQGWLPSGKAWPLWEVLNGTAQEDVNLEPDDVMIQDRVSAGWLVGWLAAKIGRYTVPIGTCPSKESSTLFLHIVSN